jgi:hypothetical protein
VREGRSRVEYIYSFEARPASVAPVLEPVMKVALDREIRRRLEALGKFVASMPVASRLRRHAPPDDTLDA